MNRKEIIARFREENPEITKSVASDSVLESWAEVGDKEICARVRLVKGQKTFSSAVGIDAYNLSVKIPKFYDIDEYPGGGVAYDNDRLRLETVASLDERRENWRDASNGTPFDYYRRGPDVVLGRKPDAIKDIEIYTVLVSDDFDDDSKLPFNQLSYLEPFHYSLVLYLKMRVFMGKVKKKDPAAMAKLEYEDYVKWMKNEVDRGIYTAIQIRPPTNYRGRSRYWTR